MRERGVKQIVFNFDEFDGVSGDLKNTGDSFRDYRGNLFL